MPMNRYEIRDEYSLADPELYRAADKDDPEALLEGVAMAGLVGVLRQLGDLAEFAAEIFHDLHEEVTATAARGHNLMIRVQQLEAEVPSIEKAFLSQTDLSSFYYNAGVDWHANLRLDQNLVTQGDLPRFVMDSYEECRGPPRLFLLDKFDVAGAGACLKRYTDPSFFKMETSATATPAVQREKKIRKAKKKGSRGRYGETPETLQASSHAKLHQLLLEESVESGVAKPAYRARLKRRPNRFPFDSKSGKSYMEEFLKNPSPEHKMLHEITVSSPLKMSIDDQNESPLKLRSVSPARGSEGIKSNPPYIDIEEIMPNPSMNKTGDASTDIKISGVSSHLNILTDGIPSTSDEENGGNDIAIDAESKMEGSLICYQSDEIASEIDNYVDAPSTMESEMDTDSEFRGKNDFTSCIISQPLVSVTNQEHCHSLSLDSLSTGDFSISDEGNNSYKKGMSDSPRTSAENPRSEKLPADEFPSADIHEFAIFNASSFGRTPEQFPADDVPKPVVSNNAFPVNDSGPEEGPEFERPTSSLCTANSVPGEGSARVARSDETVSNSDDDEKKRDLIFDLPCSPSSSYSKSLENASQRSSTVEHLVDGEVPCLSARADIIHHTSDSLDCISAYLVNEDDYDQKTSNEFENMVSPANMDNITFPNRINTEKIASKENATPVKMDNKVTQLTGNFANNYTDIAHNGDNVTPEVSEGDQNNLYSKDPNVVSETVDSEDYSPVLPEAGLVTFDKEFSAEGLATINGTSEPGIPKTSEVMDLQTGIADLDLNDPIALESSLIMHENLEDSSRISYTEEKDGVNLDSGIAGLQLTDIPTSESWKLLSQVPEPLDELSTSTDQSDNVGMDSHVPAVSENIISKNVRSPAGLGKSIEEHVPCFEDLGVGVLENDATSLSGSKRESQLEEKENSDLSRSHAESGLVEEVDEREAAALDFAAVCRTKHDDDPKPEVSHTNFSSYLDSEVKHMVDVVNASQILTPLEQSGLGNQVSDVDSLHVSSLAEELILPGNIELPFARIDNELPDHSQIRSSQLSSVIPTSQLQMLDHDYDKGFDNFASSSPSPNYPPSLSVLPGLRDYDTVAYAYPKDPSGFMFPPGNLVTETNEVNMHQSPSLPPLPPLQWRIGKLQHASSTTVVDKMEINEVFPQAIFPSEISTGNVSSMPEQTKRSSIQSPQMTIHEENHEQGCPSSEVIAMYETVSLPQKVENKQEQRHTQLLNPSRESEVPSPAEEVGAVAEGSQMVKLPVQIVSQSASKEENTEHYSTLKADSTDQADDRKVEKDQQQHLHLVLPIEKSEVPSPAKEVGGVAEGSQMVKLPVQIVSQSASKEENAEHYSTLEADSTDQADDQKVEKDQQQHLHLVLPIEKSEVPSPAKEVGGVAEGSQMVKLPVQIVSQSASKEENAEHYSTLEADSTDQADDQQVEKDQQQPLHLALPIEKSEVPSPAKEVGGVAEGSQMLKLPVQIVSQSASKEENAEHYSTLEADSTDQAVNRKVEKEQQQHLHLVLPIEESEVPSPAVEDEVANGFRTIKLPRSCNPVIGSVAALDKSRLRKVTEQVRPQIQKQDERDALLDQIRAKSFSLKPTATSRPSIQGPNTNLKVAAILEKANAIRQALAGSDEDDEDNWSDS